MLGDTAEASDVVQEIFIKVFRNIRGFKGEAALKTWIFRIALSEILNRLRWWKSRHRSSTVSLDDQPNGHEYYVPDSGPSPEEIARQEKQKAEFLARMAQREERMREQQARAKVALIPAVLTPLMLALLSGIIGFVIVGMFAPLITLIQSVSGGGK